jgi:transposase-like protein
MPRTTKAKKSKIRHAHMEEYGGTRSGGLATKTFSAYDPIRTPYIACEIVKTYGARISTLAKIFGVKERTIISWRDKHPEFREALKSGRDEFNADMVEDALLKRALGYKVKERQQKSTYIRYKEDRNLPAIQVPAKEVIIIEKEVPPDVKAAMYFLNNRRGKRWSSVSNVNIQSEHKVASVAMKADLSKMNADQLRTLRQLVQQTQGGVCLDAEQPEVAGFLELASQIESEEVADAEFEEL